MQLMKERLDLQKIVEYVSTHHETLRRKHAAFSEYLEAVRESRVTVKNVYTNEKMQRSGDRKTSRRADGASRSHEPVHIPPGCCCNFMLHRRCGAESSGKRQGGEDRKIDADRISTV